MIVFLFVNLAFCANTISADTNENVKSKKLEMVYELFQTKWNPGTDNKNVNVFDLDFFEQIKDKNKQIMKYIFNNLKNEFDVASCIFWGIAQTAGIEKAVIYLHTTKYVVTSLRYSLNPLVNNNCAGKLEKELAPFATVLNSVLLYGEDKISKTTYTGETFMCEEMKGKVIDGMIVFHTFMPSSTDVRVAIKYAEKRKLYAAKKKGDIAREEDTGICLYIFDNSAFSKYRPREITKLSYEPDDAEAVYPIGAPFRRKMCLETAKQIAKNFKPEANIICLELLVNNNEVEDTIERDPC